MVSHSNSDDLRVSCAAVWKFCFGCGVMNNVEKIFNLRLAFTVEIRNLYIVKVVSDNYKNMT